MHSKIEIDKDKHALELCKQIQMLDDDNYQQLDIAEGFDLNHYSKHTKGWLPIHFAAHLGKENIIKSLIDKGANPFLGCNSIDKSGFKETWANCFFKIKEDGLREKVKDYRNNQINNHNQDNTLVGLPEIIIIRIGLLLLLEQATCFNSLLRTTNYFSDILKPYVHDIKKIHDINVQIQCNNRKIDYNPMDDITLTDEEALRTRDYLDKGGRVNNIQTLNHELDEKIESIYESITKKMTL
jgi:hypothetical protein